MFLSLRQLFAATAAVVLTSVPGVGAQDTRVPSPPPGDDSVVLLARAAAYVQHYFARAQSVVTRERVSLQPLARDLTPNAPARRLEYELRVEWAPSPDGGPIASPSVLRQLMRVDGRAPRPKDEPGCMDPRAVSPEPLEVFLPDQQREHVFRTVGSGRTDGRRTAIIEYKRATKGPPNITWNDDCVSVELPGGSTGRAWIDPATGEVLRLDERLNGRFEIPVPREHQRFGSARWMVIERADTTIRYKRVTFRDPDETLLVPASIMTVTVIRDAGVPQMRVTQTFDDYRRFVTDVRVLPESEP